jgi:hypothetical protein
MIVSLFLRALIGVALAGLSAPGAVLIVLPAPGDDDACAKCHWDDDDPFTCTDHVAMENAAIRDLGPVLTGEDPATRVAALERVAALTDAHPHAPSAAVAARLGQALQDPEAVVRDAALDLLMAGQHPGAAIEAMGQALATAAERSQAISMIDPETGRPVNGSLDRKSSLFTQRIDLIANLGMFRDKRALSELRTHLLWSLDQGDDLQARFALEAMLGMSSAESTRVAVAMVRAAQKGQHEQAAKRMASELSDWADDRALIGAPDTPSVDPINSSTWKRWIDKGLEFPGPLGHLDAPLDRAPRRSEPGQGAGSGRR